MLHNLKNLSKTVGLKQTSKAIQSGSAQQVFLASDADEYVANKVRGLCKEFDVPITAVDTMKELGEACGIHVGAATAAILKQAQK
jgi:large subunit ribosomal protein L7A